MRDDAELLLRLAEDVAGDADAVVLFGMGGSSLAPEVLRASFAASIFHVLDTTHPRAIRALQAELDLERTLFLSASKSGSTLETRAHTDYFWKLAPRGEQWVAITDPGSELARLGAERTVRRGHPGRADDRRALLGPLALRARPGGADGDRPRRPPRPRLRDGRGLPPRRGQPRPRARPRARRGLAGGPRQGLPARRRRLRALGRAAPRRVDRQAGQGAGPRPGRVRPRPRPPAARGAAAGAARARPGVLPLGVRDRRRRRDPRDQPVRPARRPGGEGPDERGARERRRRRSSRPARSRSSSPVPRRPTTSASRRSSSRRRRTSRRSSGSPGRSASAPAASSRTASGRATCTRPGSCTRAARTAGASCRSSRTTAPSCRSPASHSASPG